jgi:pimeloyl-ACP methyl ester carboxylesterase
MTRDIDARPGAVPWTAIGPQDGPAIVFLHGTRLTRSQWWPQVRRLARRYRCVAIDLPAHGARAAEPFTLESATAAVVEAIDAAIPGRRAVLVGLSLGGYVAMETAERYPERVAGLVLAGCSAEALGPTAMPFRGLAWLLEHTPRPVFDLLNIAFFRARYRRAVSEPIIAGGFWSAGGAQAVRTLLGRRFLERLGRLWTPVLIVNGGLDPVFGPGGDLWAASCRRGRQVVIPWAGHLSNLDRPGLFAGYVDGFAREVARGA